MLFAAIVFLFTFDCKNNVFFLYLQEKCSENCQDAIEFSQNILFGAYAPLDFQENLLRWPENLNLRTQRRRVTKIYFEHGKN